MTLKPRHSRALLTGSVRAREPPSAILMAGSRRQMEGWPAHTGHVDSGCSPVCLGEGDLTRSLQNFVERGLWGGPQCGRSCRAHSRLSPGQQSPTSCPGKWPTRSLTFPGIRLLAGAKWAQRWFTAMSPAHPAVPSPLELPCRTSDDHRSVQRSKPWVP